MKCYNKYYFKNLSDYDVKWSLYENGKEAQSGLLSIGEVAPRTRTQITVPYQFSKLKADSEYFVKIQFLLKDNMPWADKNFAQAERTDTCERGYRTSFYRHRSSRGRQTGSDDD